MWLPADPDDRLVRVQRLLVSAADPRLVKPGGAASATAEKEEENEEQVLGWVSVGGRLEEDDKPFLVSIDDFRAQWPSLPLVRAPALAPFPVVCSTDYAISGTAFLAAEGVELPLPLPLKSTSFPCESAATAADAYPPVRKGMPTINGDIPLAGLLPEPSSAVPGQQSTTQQQQQQQQQQLGSCPFCSCAFDGLPVQQQEAHLSRCMEPLSL